MRFFSHTILVLFGLLIATVEIGWAQVRGCTDPQARNYNAEATVNDGSCQYAHTTIKAEVLGALDSLVEGSSTLFHWQGGFWTYNDHVDNCLYRIDSTNATIIERLCINGLRNQDTEEITQDSLYLYFGDFGNNAGNRHNLQILRISKESIVNQTFKVDTIWFDYEDNKTLQKLTDFDCEAFIVTDDSIYLFTKQWFSSMTTVYSLPKTPGTHIAHRRETYNVKGLITGATYIPEYQLIVLCGYDYNKNNIFSALHPFLYLLYDFKDNRFFSGNKRRLDFASGVKAQIEGIATSDGLDFYLTCEHFHTARLGITFDFPAQLRRVDLWKYLMPYLNGIR